MEITNFVHLVAKEGHGDAVDSALAEVSVTAAEEAACLEMRVFRSARDLHEFRVFSRWTGQAAFEQRTDLPHVLKFKEEAYPLIERIDLVQVEPLSAMRGRDQ